MKRFAVILGLLLIATTLGCITQSQTSTESTVKEEQKLVIYSYDSFEYLASEVIPKFEEKYGVKVELQLIGDAGEVLNRLILEKDNPRADLVIGIDNSLLAKAIEAGILEPYKPENINLVPENLIFDPTFHLTPYDYGYIAINYREDMVQNPPKSLEDLTKPEWKGKLVIEDPRTSSPGAAFLLWTIAVYGDDGYLYYWEKLKENDVHIVKGWTEAWTAFMNGEFPLVLSYATSPAATVYYDNITYVKAIAFEEGNYMQIEGAGIVKGAKNKELAKKFIEFMLTEDFQSAIPTNQWMYPVNPNVELPEVFKYALQPEEIKPVTLDPEYVKENFERWIKEWTALMVEGKSPEEIISSRG
ncbi:ABC transporter substrate-binding protein [Thermococcus litoralis DSM 5473]|uniref:ABC transporter substrate-binding protein n=2 Tax=Thermococcus litoralis TaxID=2265 RepID=H3ZNF9_THELN|nr:thiamine ABC transporter substrate binding subunit [Thermococcus litoralis]AAG45399.1 putative solute binding lipoprotein [Thermococcus litoralis]EHR78503.1 ABC transporter substrate-binding protein [Thermococcus litoralis DSM 5473]